jgi:hypothetical protein
MVLPAVTPTAAWLSLNPMSLTERLWLGVDGTLMFIVSLGPTTKASWVSLAVPSQKPVVCLLGVQDQSWG